MAASRRTSPLLRRLRLQPAADCRLGCSSPRVLSAHRLTAPRPPFLFFPLPMRSMEDARKARQAGADSILIKWELVQQYAGDPGCLAQLLDELRYATSGDD